MDHAADGKKKHVYMGEWRKSVLFKDLGTEKIDAMDLDDVFKLLHTLTDEEITDARAHALTLDEHAKQLTPMEVLEIKLGTKVFEQMSMVQQGLAYLFVFGSCSTRTSMHSSMGLQR
ncbi:hypothetical protein DXG01_014179 [Tephrocybe rancida]|nr:hypothetical protein DXG01_014179 [Tephrocybe rancida]